MKIVGKMGSQYMVSASEDEILQMVFGQDHPEYDEKIKKDVYPFMDKIRGGETELKINQVFSRMMRLYNLNVSQGRDSILSKVEIIKDLLEPIQVWINNIKENEKQ